jgi:DNA polymerase III delta prime subunit
MRPVLRWMSRWAQGKFDRQPSWQAFVDWQTYYAASLRTDATHALIQHTGPHLGDPTHQNELLNGMEGGRGAALVCAPPGCGKSRFALELARRLEQAHRGWQAVFVRHDEAAVREELPQLMQLRRVVFIVDDAHECPKLVELLAAACTQASTTASLQLVCLTRSTCRAQMSRAINSAFPPGMIQEIDLGRPTPQLVRTLIDQLLPQSSPHHRDTIARFVRQSYFGAVLVCGMLGREAKLPQTFQRQDLHDRICREPLRGAADGVCPIEPAMRAVAVYAALAPVSRARADVREWAAQLSGLTPPTVDGLIDRVLKAGLFQEHGHGLMRPMPDLRGDLILEAVCSDSLGKPTPFSTELLEQLLEAEPAAAVRNCADIGQLFGTVQEADLISKLVLERAHTTPVGNRSHALKLLQLMQPLAAGRPATVIELARIMESRGLLRRDPPAAGLVSNDSVEMGTFTLLMSAGEVGLEGRSRGAGARSPPVCRLAGRGSQPGARSRRAQSFLRVRDRPEPCTRTGGCQYSPSLGRRVGYRYRSARRFPERAISHTRGANPASRGRNCNLIAIAAESVP